MTPQQTKRIRQHAFSLWEAAGRPQGRDLDYWLQAEHEIIRKKKPVKTAQAQAAKAGKSRKVTAKSPLAGKTTTTKKKASAKTARAKKS